MVGNVDLSYSNISNIIQTFINTLNPIIYIQSVDFIAVDEVIKSINIDARIFEYNNAMGIVDFYNKSPKFKCSLEKFLIDYQDEGYEKESFIILKDIHKYIEDPIIIAILKRIAQMRILNKDYKLTLFIISSKKVIPIELEAFITFINFPYPQISEIRSIIKEYDKILKIENKRKLMESFTNSLRGLTCQQIHEVIRNIAHNDGKLDSNSYKHVFNVKSQMLKKIGLLELVYSNSDISSLGGLKGLKSWLKRKAEILRDINKAIESGVDKPKGIIVVGMPGCGKSLSAKITADLFKMPLLRLDIGSLLGKYVGESEENMFRALKLSEAMSPCVLWIDEIEKAFSGIGNDDGGGSITTRLYGQFLTWMQENESLVFIVATANDISKIPVELLRKGRFDEVFYVDLPNDSERKDILEIQLCKRIIYPKDKTIKRLEEEYGKLFNERFNLKYQISEISKERGLSDKTKQELRSIINERNILLKEKKIYLEKEKRYLCGLVSKELVNKTNSYMGAELEMVVKNALELAFIEKKKIDKSHLNKAIGEILPMAISAKNKVNEIYEAAKVFNFKNASKNL